MREYKKYIVFGVIGILLMVVSFFEIKDVSEGVMECMPITNKTIILDAGHGGIDPGALAEDKDTAEKEVNLSITLRLRELIESSGGLVILTREDDSSLYSESGNKTTRQKYNENLKNRKKIINESKSDMFVSIHLNKFKQSEYYGAQTFYPKGKDDSKELSKYIQAELKRVVDKTNNREIKPTQDIYLLKENEIPSVLIECGFLSNDKEAKLLADKEYQEKIAWSIYVGIQRYFSSNEYKN